MFFAFERYIFQYDRVWHHLLSALLWPFSLIYCLAGVIKKYTSTVPANYTIPVISVGNVTVGGSGKTPFVIALCKLLDSPCIVTRGYGRKTSGLLVVSERGDIVCSVEDAGDEAYMMAKSVEGVSVIACENRHTGIKKAQELGAKSIVMDDGFGAFSIAKVDVLLRPYIPYKNRRCLPAGPFRYPHFFEQSADIIATDGVDFFRDVAFPVGCENAVLVSAISNPKRLEAFLPTTVVHKEYFPDHYFFTAEDAKRLQKRYPHHQFVCTSKDADKLRHVGLACSEMRLSMRFEPLFLARMIATIREKYPMIAIKNQAS